jgi:hypothetical protein
VCCVYQTWFWYNFFVNFIWVKLSLERQLIFV